MAHCSPEDQLAAGTMLGSYRIVRCIGVGGMGSVYEAQHEELGKRVALKTPHLRDNQTAEGRARFVREGKAAASIRHPHVVDITDVGEVDNIAFLVMEYLEGETLAQRIKREGPLSAECISDIIVPVTAALGEAHRQGVIHRDLKPDNIFLSQSVMGSPQPKLLDFGISKVIGAGTNPNLTSTHAFLGTPFYVSPEQLESTHSTNALSDQYSLGVVLYEAITAINPFSHHPSLMRIATAITNGDYQQLGEFRPPIDSALGSIAGRAMAIEPKKRFQTIEHLGAALLPLASVTTQTAWKQFFQGVEPEAEPDPPEASRKAAYLPWAVGAGLAATAVAGWLLWSVGRRTEEPSERSLASQQAVAKRSTKPDQRRLSVRPLEQRPRGAQEQASTRSQRTTTRPAAAEWMDRKPTQNPRLDSPPAGTRPSERPLSSANRATKTPESKPKATVVPPRTRRLPPSNSKPAAERLPGGQSPAEKPARGASPPAEQSPTVPSTTPRPAGNATKQPATAGSNSAQRVGQQPVPPRTHPKTDNLDPWR